jgi:hypothetical protein
MDQQILQVVPINHADIRQAWLETKPTRVRTPSSIVADCYGITELEVIASGYGYFAQRLCGDWRELLIGIHLKDIDMSFCYDEEGVEQGWLVTLPGADTPSRAELFDPQGDHPVNTDRAKNNNKI